MSVLSVWVALGACWGQISLPRNLNLELGTSVREVWGRNQGFKLHAPLPLWELRLKKTFNEELDGFIGLGLNRGAIDAEHPSLSGEARGEFDRLTLGLDYYPDRHRLLGLELGLEAFGSRYEMRASLGPVKQSKPDELWGAGANLGLIGSIPLPLGDHGRYSLVWGAGYSFCVNSHHQAESNLSGWYGRLSLSINLDQSYNCQRRAHASN